MQKFVHSLKFKIIVIVMAVFLIGMVLETAVWVQSSMEQTKDTISESVSTSLNVSNQYFENTIKNIDRICALAASNSTSSRCVSSYLHVMSVDSGASDREKVEIGREVYDYLFQLCNFKYYLNGMSVCTLNGSQQSFGIVMGEKELLAQNWMQDFLADDEDMKIIPPHNSLPGNKNYTNQVFSIIRKIKYGNVVKGVVLADINYDVLEDYYPADKISGQQILISYGEDVNMIYPQDKLDWTEKLSSINSLDVEEEEYGKVKIAGEEYMLLKKEMPITKWNIYSLVSYRSMMDASLEALKKILVITVCIICFVCIATLLAVFKTTKGLSQLAKAVNRISNQNLELGIVIKSKDEVGELSRQVNKMLKRIHGLIEEIYQSEKEKRELEIMALQEQINPHFLYNTLNIISYLAQLQGRKNIQKVSDSLSDMLHLALSPEKFISVRQEIDYLKKYLGIMEYKYSGKFVSEFAVDETAYSCMLPKLILQPLVENSLKHGIALLTRPGLLQVCVNREKDNLYIAIKDNGKGMSAETADQINSQSPGIDESRQRIGVYNVRDRISLLYGEQSRFFVSSAEDEYTLIEITIPVKESGE